MQILFEHPYWTLIFICAIGFWVTAALSNFEKK